MTRLMSLAVLAFAAALHGHDALASESALSADQWKSAVTNLYTENVARRSNDGDGVTSNLVCFQDASVRGKCAAQVFEKRDAFNKVRIYTPLDSALNKSTGQYYVYSFVVLEDCGRPAYVLRPQFFSKNGWLFLNRATFLADGDVTLELEPYSPTSVERDAESYGVEEKFSIVAREKELAALRVVAKAKKVMVRLTGTKGYVPVKEEYSKRIVLDVRSALDVYDMLLTATVGAPGKSCK